MAATEKVSTRFSHLMPTVYGRMHEITDAGEFSDVAYTQSGLDPHTDMPYLECPPGIITLHVVYHFGEGGESVLLDGYHMAKQLQVKSPDTYKMLTTTPLTISNRSEKRENRYWFTLRVPIIALNPVTNEPETLRYNNYDKAPLDSIPQDQLPEFYSALTEFSRMTEDPQYQLQFKLKPGTVMFVDNHRLIHGRTDYTGRRCIFGTFLPRDDTISAARRLELVEWLRSFFSQLWSVAAYTLFFIIICNFVQINKLILWYLFQENYVNIVADIALPPCISKSSVTNWHEHWHLLWNISLNITLSSTRKDLNCSRIKM